MGFFAKKRADLYLQKLSAAVAQPAPVSADRFIQIERELHEFAEKEKTQLPQLSLALEGLTMEETELTKIATALTTEETLSTRLKQTLKQKKMSIEYLDLTDKELTRVEKVMYNQTRSIHTSLGRVMLLLRTLERAAPIDPSISTFPQKEFDAFRTALTQFIEQIKAQRETRIHLLTTSRSNAKQSLNEISHIRNVIEDQTLGMSELEKAERANWTLIENVKKKNERLVDQLQTMTQQFKTLIKEYEARASEIWPLE